MYIRMYVEIAVLASRKGSDITLTGALA